MDRLDVCGSDRYIYLVFWIPRHENEWLPASVLHWGGGRCDVYGRRRPLHYTAYCCVWGRRIQLILRINTFIFRITPAKRLQKNHSVWGRGVCAFLEFQKVPIHRGYLLWDHWTYEEVSKHLVLYYVKYEYSDYKVNTTNFL